MKIFIIRHGQTTGDIEDRFGGNYDDNLTEEGKIQAVKLADKLVNLGIEKIFASPLKRAQQTAGIISNKIDAPIVTIENIRERNHYGVLTGMVKAEAKDKYPEIVELVKDKFQTVEGGEGYEDFGKRVKEAFAKITNSDHQALAIISHGGAIRYIFREILNKGEIDVDDCGFAELKIVNGKPELITTDGITLEA